MERRNVLKQLGLGLVAMVWPFRLTASKENESNTKIWTTRDGRQVRIVDMTDDHLRNTIFYLNRRNGELMGEFGFDEHPYYGFPVGIIRRYSPNPTDRWPIYADLLREAERRKLTWTP
jgi:hypothetical protein